MSQPAPPQPRKRPKQARSLMLVKAIQEACLRIMEREGAEQLTAQRIADVAGINIASFYQYYPNKEAVLTDVFEAQVTRCTEAARERFVEIDRLSRTSLEQTLAAIVELEVEQRLMLYRMNPGFYRAWQGSFDVHGRVNELTLSLSNPGWSEWFPQFLERHKALLRSEDIATLSRIASHALSGVLLSAVAEEPELLEQETFKQELVTLLLNYLC